MKNLDLKKRQEIALDILSEFSRFCDEKNYYYTLEFGTLLGAIRHSGFIPWDDDIDVSMPREDYEQLIKNNRISDHIALDHYSDGLKHDTNFAKLYDDRTFSVNFNKEKRCGVYIDIYPVDYIPSSLFERITQRIRLFFYYFATKASEKPIRKTNNIFLKISYRLFSSFFQKRGKNYYSNKLNIVASTAFRKSKKMSILIEPDKINKRVILDEDYFDRREIEFEGRTFSILAKYDSRLKREYGDYMCLPPLNEREGHFSYTFFECESVQN